MILQNFRKKIFWKKNFKNLIIWPFFYSTLDGEGSRNSDRQWKSRDFQFVGRGAPNLSPKNRGIVYSTLWPIADLADFGPFFGQFFCTCQWDSFFLIKKVKKRRFLTIFFMIHAIQMITLIQVWKKYSKKSRTNPWSSRFRENENLNYSKESKSKIYIVQNP